MMTEEGDMKGREVKRGLCNGRQHGGGGGKGRGNRDDEHSDGEVGVISVVGSRSQ